MITVSGHVPAVDSSLQLCALLAASSHQEVYLRATRFKRNGQSSLQLPSLVRKVTAKLFTKGRLRAQVITRAYMVFCTKSNVVDSKSSLSRKKQVTTQKDSNGGNQLELKET
jgi:hypothetical protein